ncbi:MAG: peptidylprolyl isomerase [Alphaproteobacteria bacterium]|nr:peptidylprolyl isomerase [Alphaproteobacteria bacterium]
MTIRRSPLPRLASIAALAGALVFAGAVPPTDALAQGRPPGRGPASQPPGSQGEVMRIAAVVNDDIVSVYEVQARVRLLLVTSGLPPTPEMTQRLQGQVLRLLIDERLQLQEAQRLGITIQDGEIEQALRRIEEANRMPPNMLPEVLRRAGVPPSALNGQIRVGLAWRRTIEQRLIPNIQISDEDVADVRQRLQASRGNVENLLGEIFLPVDNPENDDEIRNTALSLIEQMRRGMPFPAIALQFSQSASASSGGDIGWVEQGTLDDTAEAAIRQLNPGQITTPLRSIGGYYIYALRQRRTIAMANPDDTIVSVAQLRLPIGARGDQQALQDLAEQIRVSVNGCNDLRQVASELRVPPPSEPQRGRIGALPPQFRQIINELRVGEPSRAIQLPQGMIILMVCERAEEGNMPNRDQIVETLVRQRVDTQARRLLRDLRRAAFIDIRV